VHLLKQTTIAYEKLDWVNSLTTTLLNLICAIKRDADIMSAEMVYGQTLHLPSDFFEEGKYRYTTRNDKNSTEKFN